MREGHGGMTKQDEVTIIEVIYHRKADTAGEERSKF